MSHFRLSAPLLSVVILLAGCSGSPSSRPDGDAPPAADAGSAGSNVGTSLGEIGSHDSVAGTVRAPSPLNAEPSQAQQAAQANAGICADLRGQIRSAQADERAAPTTSTDEDIVNASLAKADQKIADLQQQYDQLGCSAAQMPPTHVRSAVIPPAPAPGAPPP